MTWWLRCLPWGACCSYGPCGGHMLIIACWWLPAWLPIRCHEAGSRWGGSLGGAAPSLTGTSVCVAGIFLAMWLSLVARRRLGVRMCWWLLRTDPALCRHGAGKTWLCAGSLPGLSPECSAAAATVVAWAMAVAAIPGTLRGVVVLWPFSCSVVLLGLHCARMAAPLVRIASATCSGTLCGLATWAGRPTEFLAVQLGHAGRLLSSTAWRNSFLLYMLIGPFTMRTGCLGPPGT